MFRVVRHDVVIITPGSILLTQCAVALGFYGKAGAPAAACPTHSTGPAKSTSIDNCMCKSGYYGSHGVCHKCVGRSHSRFGATHVGECKCDVGYFNDIVDVMTTTLVDEVHCVPLPPRFHYKSTGVCALKDPSEVKYGNEQIVGPDSTVDPMTLAQMYKYLAGIDVARLRRGDFDGLCQGLFVHLYRNDQICGSLHPLFDKYAAANETRFLGYVTVRCGTIGPETSNARGVAALLNMCSTPCMESDASTATCCKVSLHGVISLREEMQQKMRRPQDLSTRDI